MFLVKLRKKACVFLSLVLSILMMTVIPVAAAVNNDNICSVESNSWKDWPQAVDIQASTGIVMDAKTGTILFDKGMDDKRYPASITKIMTALIAIENSSPEDLITFTETGMADAYSGSSNIQPQLGETFTMEQCIYMIMLKSANDVSTQVAEVIGGSVEGFVDMMNQRAVELGCTNTHFNNASGLPDEDHYTSAHDMALITQEALKNEQFRKVASTTNYTVPPTNLTPGSREYRNHHALMFPEDTTWYYDGCVGGKTGYTDSALNTLVTFVNRDGMELISVVMHGESGPSVCTDTMTIMDYGYANFRYDELGKVATATGGIVVENKVLNNEEYEEFLNKDKVTTTPTPDTIEEPENSKNSASEIRKSDSQTAYAIIGVLGGLVVLGIVAIIITVVIRRKKRK